MSQHYSDPSRASDPHALPDVERRHTVMARHMSEWKHRELTANKEQIERWVERMFDRIDDLLMAGKISEAKYEELSRGIHQDALAHYRWNKQT